MAMTQGPSLAYHRISAAEFLEVIELTELTATFLRPANLVSDYGLAARIRGAWGHRLFQLGAHGQLACNALLDSDNSEPKPFCLWVDDHDDCLIVRLRLFGTADIFRDVSFDALIAAMTEDSGLEMGREKRQRRTMRLIDAQWTKRIGLPIRPNQARANLRFVSPLCLMADKALSLDYRKLWRSAHHRMQTMAAHHGLAIIDEAKHFDDNVARVSYDDSKLLPVTPWTRWSSRDHRRKTTAGMIGSLKMDGLTGNLWPYLIAGENMMVGSNCAMGLGRFEVT